MSPKLCALAALLALGLSAAEKDHPPAAEQEFRGTQAMKSDSQARARAERLEKAYRKAADPDQRFWIVDELDRLLEGSRDESALAPLLEAADKDSKPDVRRRALAALEGWRTLPPNSRERWHDRVARAAARAEKDRASRVREAGESLDGALKKPVASAPPPAPEAPAPGRWRLLAGAVLWAFCLQLAVLAWIRLAASMLAQAGEKAALASRWLHVAARMEYFLFPCASALALLPTLGLLEGLAFAHALAPLAPMSARGWLDLGLAAYVSAGFAIHVPSLLLACAAGRGEASSGWWRGVWRALRDAPGAFVFAFLWLTVAPVSFAYRLVRAREPRSPWQWLAACGSPLALYLAAASGARSEVGWRGGLARAWRKGPLPSEADWLARPLAQAPLVLLFLAAPVIFTVALAPAHLLSNGPTRLGELWRVSEADFVMASGLWTSSLAVAVFLATWAAAAAAFAGERARGGAA